MNPTPSQLYQQTLLAKGYQTDPAQYSALKALDELQHKLLKPQPSNSNTLAKHSKIFGTNQLPPIKGLYLWGQVGRGKTFLMDLFYQSLADDISLRLHFHRFMARIHQELTELSGQKNPLKVIAKRLSQECRVLCFDEFYVDDIGDAMILAGLLDELFNEGLVFVATSNIAIGDLYQNGLQRRNFTPAIKLLEQHCNSIELDGQEDHRLRETNGARNYHVVDNSGLTMVDQGAEFQSSENDYVTNLFLRFTSFSTQNSNPQPSSSHIRLLGRDIAVHGLYEKTVWFDYQNLCCGPRSQLDYIELANNFDVILLSNVPKLGGEKRSWIKARGTEDGNFGITATSERQLSYASEDDGARRFIALVDELYERGTQLHIISDVPLKDLYQGGSLEFQFRRTISRIWEM